MFRSVKFVNTLSQEQNEEIGNLRIACNRFRQRRMHGYSTTEADRAEFAAAKEKLTALNETWGITPSSIYVIMKNVNDEYLYDIVEAPPFLHQECMLPHLIEFLVSTLDDRHNTLRDFKEDFKTWEFWNIKMPPNKGIERKS